MENTNISLYFCINVYLIKPLCKNTKRCIGGFSKKRTWLYLAIVHAHRFEKQDNPMCETSIIYSPYEWAYRIQNICDSEHAPKYLKGINVLEMMPTSTYFRELNVLAQKGLLHKELTPKGHTRYSVIVNRVRCAPCILEKKNIN